MIADISKLHSKVKENGYLKVDSFVSKSDAEILEQKTLKAIEKSSDKHLHRNTDFVKVISVSKEDAKKERYFKYLNEIFLDQFLNSFIENYFETQKVEISKIFLAESSNSGEKVDVLPYKMHFDKTRYLKFMIYLRDVFEGDGGVTFAKKEWNTKLQEELLKREALKEENVVEVKDLSQIEEITGPKGTAAIFDTNITHKAGQVLGENKRLVIRIDSRAIG